MVWSGTFAHVLSSAFSWSVLLVNTGILKIASAPACPNYAQMAFSGSKKLAAVIACRNFVPKHNTGTQHLALASATEELNNLVAMISIGTSTLAGAYACPPAPVLTKTKEPSIGTRISASAYVTGNCPSMMTTSGTWTSV